VFARTPALWLVARVTAAVTLTITTREISLVTTLFATLITTPVALALALALGGPVNARLAALFGTRLGPASPGEVAALQALHDAAQFLQLPLVARFLDLRNFHDLQHFFHGFERLLERLDHLLDFADKLIDGGALRLGRRGWLAGSRTGRRRAARFHGPRLWTGVGMLVSGLVRWWCRDRSWRGRRRRSFSMDGGLRGFGARHPHRRIVKG
jgi:hypothetical protein